MIQPMPQPFRSLPTLLIAVLALAICAMACLPLGVILGLYAYYQSQELIFPGVLVGETRLQGKSIAEAAAQLHKDWNMQKTITLTDGLHTWNVAPADLGLGLDALATAAEAYSVGRGYSLPAALGQMIFSLRQGWQIQPVVQFEEQKAQALLDSLNQVIRQPPVNSSLQFEAGRLVVVPGRIGYEFNLEETLQALRANPTGVLADGRLNIPLRPLAPETADLSAVLESAQQLLDRPTVLRGYDPVSDEHFEWPVPPDVLASWLIIRTEDETTTVGVATDRVAAYLNTLNPSLSGNRFIDAERHSRPAAEAIRRGQAYTIILSHPPTVYTVRAGDTLLKIAWKVGFPLWMILQANPRSRPSAGGTGAGHPFQR